MEGVSTGGGRLAADQLRLFPRSERLPVLVVDRGQGDGAHLVRRLRRSQRLDATVAAPEELRTGGRAWTDGTRPACALVMVREHPAVLGAVRRWAQALGDVPLVVVVDGRRDLCLSVLGVGAEEVLDAGSATGAALERAVLAAVARRAADAAAAGRVGTDPLTGLHTRARLDAELPALLRRVGNDGSGVAVLYADLDRFKAVNDTLGHGAGDEVLVEAADRLRACVRGSDVVVRLGGDEFVVVLTGAAAASIADEVAERVVEAFDPPFRAAGEQVSVGISIGLAVAEPGDSATALVARADRALYRAKQRGRHRVARWHADVAPGCERDAAAVEALRAGLADGALALVDRPVVDPGTDRLLGHHWEVDWGAAAPPDGCARRSPAAVAAECGESVALFRWTVAALAERLVERPALGPLRAFLDLPAAELAGSPTRALGPLLDAPGVDLSAVVVCVAESALVDGERFRPGLLELARSGVRVAVSDFGAHHGSLGLLERHPFDSVWLDRQGIDGLAACPVRRARLRAVVEVAAALGQQVVVAAPSRPEDARALHAVDGVAVVGGVRAEVVDLVRLDAELSVRARP